MKFKSMYLVLSCSFTEEILLTNKEKVKRCTLSLLQSYIQPSSTSIIHQYPSKTIHIIYSSFHDDDDDDDDHRPHSDSNSDSNR